MRAFSLDLRVRIVAALELGEYSLREVAYIFSVSLSFVVRLLQRQRRTGSLHPKPHAGGPTPCLDEAAVQRLLELVRQQPDATLAELRDRLNITCALSTIARVLSRHGYTRKKKTLQADEQATPRVAAARARFDAHMATVDPAHLLFVDETGATTNMTRRYGRAPRGERVRGSAPGQWQNVTLIVGLRPTEVVAPFIIVGATATPTFQQYVDEVLGPTVGPGDVVVWDNLKPHQNTETVALVRQTGARVEPLPPYSPDKTPIEELFSKVKEYLRATGARTVQAVTQALVEALQQVTPADIQGWFQHRCAYAMH